MDYIHCSCEEFGVTAVSNVPILTFFHLPSNRTHNVCPCSMNSNFTHLNYQLSFVTFTSKHFQGLKTPWPYGYSLHRTKLGREMHLSQCAISICDSQVFPTACPVGCRSRLIDVLSAWNQNLFIKQTESFTKGENFQVINFILRITLSSMEIVCL